MDENFLFSHNWLPRFFAVFFLSPSFRFEKKNERRAETIQGILVSCCTCNLRAVQLHARGGNYHTESPRCGDRSGIGFNRNSVLFILEQESEEGRKGFITVT